MVDYSSLPVGCATSYGHRRSRTQGTQRTANYIKKEQKK